MPCCQKPLQFSDISDTIPFEPDCTFGTAPECLALACLNLTLTLLKEQRPPLEALTDASKQWSVAITQLEGIIGNFSWWVARPAALKAGCTCTDHDEMCGAVTLPSCGCGGACTCQP